MLNRYNSGCTVGQTALRVARRRGQPVGCGSSGETPGTPLPSFPAPAPTPFRDVKYSAQPLYPHSPILHHHHHTTHTSPHHPTHLDTMKATLFVVAALLVGSVSNLSLVLACKPCRTALPGWRALGCRGRGARHSWPGLSQGRWGPDGCTQCCGCALHTNTARAQPPCAFNLKCRLRGFTSGRLHRAHTTAPPVAPS